MRIFISFFIICPNEDFLLIVMCLLGIKALLQRRSQVSTLQNLTAVPLKLSPA